MIRCPDVRFRNRETVLAYCVHILWKDGEKNVGLEGCAMNGNGEKPVRIARVWRGVAVKSKADGFLDYMMKTGVKDYRLKKGNLGVFTLRRDGKKHVEFLMISLWDSIDSIRDFAGDEIDKAVYYPEDEKFLVRLEPKVKHYEVFAEL